MKKPGTICILLFALAAGFASCRKGDPVIPSESVEVNPWEKVSGDIYGFFLLNEGNMGSNKASLDYYDYETGVYTRNIYGERNPQEVKELGDVGNDLKIYGNKLYAVINCSNYLEVMDAGTAKHIAKIAVPNCRYLAFKGKYAYLTSYAGPVDPNNSRIGYVAKIDTATLKVVAECTVGYQPEEMAVVGNKLYIANSGGYNPLNYDRTVSVIDLDTFTELYKIDVGINLHRIRPDHHGNIYVSSRGDYYNTPSMTFIIDSGTDKVTDVLHTLPNSNMVVQNDMLYLYSTQWSHITQKMTTSYAVFDIGAKRVTTRSFICDGTEKDIKVPYGIAVHPHSGELLVTDAGNYISAGVLHCYSPEGIRKWSVSTGDIPAHIAFTTKRLKPINN